MFSSSVRLSVIALVALVAFANCGYGGRSTNVKATNVDAFADNYAKAWSSQDPDSVTRFFAENASLRVNDDKPAVGHAEIAKIARNFMTVFPDLIVTKDRVVTRADGIVEFHWTLAGTNTGPKGEGNRVRISGFEEWRLGPDGLIIASQGHLDEKEYRRQIREGL